VTVVWPHIGRLWRGSMILRTNLQASATPMSFCLSQDRCGVSWSSMHPEDMNIAIRQRAMTAGQERQKNAHGAAPRSRDWACMQVDARRGRPRQLGNGRSPMKRRAKSEVASASAMTPPLPAWV